MLAVFVFAFPGRFKAPGSRTDDDSGDEGASAGEHVHQSGASEIPEPHFLEPSAIVPAPAAYERVSKTLFFFAF